jgi:hypothetical protein
VEIKNLICEPGRFTCLYHWGDIRGLVTISEDELNSLGHVNCEQCGTVGPAVEWREGEVRRMWEEWVDAVIAECVNDGHVLMGIAFEVAQQVVEREEPEQFADKNCLADYTFWKMQDIWPSYFQE